MAVGSQEPVTWPPRVQVFARYSLVPASLPAHASAVLLEGSWPSWLSHDEETSVRGAEGDNPCSNGRRTSLDEAIDARYAWIDEAASDLAERVAAAAPLAWLNVLALRYYLVKLLRVVAFFDEQEAAQIDLVLGSHDDDYLELFRKIAAVRGIRLEVRCVESPPPRPYQPPANGVLRRFAARCNAWMDGALCGRHWKWTSASQGTEVPYYERAKLGLSDVPRILLCGNPRVLDGICTGLLQRGCQVAWLYDRFAFGSFLRWRKRGVRQLVCQGIAAHRTSDRLARSSTTGRQARRASECILFQPQPAASGNRLKPGLQQLTGHTPSCRGIDLSRPIQIWLDALRAQRGARQSQLLAQIETYFDLFRPTHMVLDEDATPMPRAAIGVARDLGVPSIVVQHGAPRVRFGFSPPAADRICVWGETSLEQLAGWGVARERIAITGNSEQYVNRRPVAGESSTLPLFMALKCRTTNVVAAFARTRALSLPRSGEHGYMVRSSTTDARTTAAAGSSRVLFYATVPPSDRRPDAVSYRLTSRTHADLVRLACLAVAQIPDAELIVKLHPRSTDAKFFERLAAACPNLRCRITRRSLSSRLPGPIGCVLNCGSSAGIEAAAAGLPVIELLPEGSLDLLPAAEWGLFGSFQPRSMLTTEPIDVEASRLAELIGKALQCGRRDSTDRAAGVFARTGRDAVDATIDAILAARSVHQAAAASHNIPDDGAVPLRRESSLAAEACP